MNDMYSIFDEQLEEYNSSFGMMNSMREEINSRKREPEVYDIVLNLIINERNIFRLEYFLNDPCIRDILHDSDFTLLCIKKKGFNLDHILSLDWSIGDGRDFYSIRDIINVYLDHEALIVSLIKYGRSERFNQCLYSLLLQDMSSRIQLIPYECFIVCISHLMLDKNDTIRLHSKYRTEDKDLVGLISSLESMNIQITRCDVDTDVIEYFQTEILKNLSL